MEEELLPIGFNKKDIDYITQGILDLKIRTISSNEVFGFLKGLVKKQSDFGVSSEFREKASSRKLAILVSKTGKKILLPFAHHAGKELDRHSRALIVSGFETLLAAS